MLYNLRKTISKTIVENILNTNKTCIFCHLNSHATNDLIKLKYDLKKIGFNFKTIKNSFLKDFLFSQKNLNSNFVSSCIVLYSNKENNFEQLVEIEKINKKLYILFIKLDKLIIDYKQFLNYTKLPKLVDSRLELVFVIEKHLSNTSSLIKSFYATPIKCLNIANKIN